MEKILLIEDSHLLRVRVTDILQACGYKNIEGFESAADIINNPDKYLVNTSLIITDIELPEVSGMTLTRQLKTGSKFSNVPIIIMSAHSNVETVEEAIDLGIADYISKPFKNELLIKKVKNIIGEPYKEEERKESNELAEKELITSIIDKEHSRAIRGKYPFSILRLSVNKDNLEVLKSRISNMLRRIDGVHIIEGKIIVLLISTNQEGLETVMNKIRKGTQSYDINIEGSICFEPESEMTLHKLLNTALS